jgi:hypothetical protein
MQTGSVMFHCKYSRHRSVLRSLAAPLTHARDRSVSRYTTNGDPWDLYAAAVVHEESLVRTDPDGYSAQPIRRSSTECQIVQLRTLVAEL